MISMREQICLNFLSRRKPFLILLFPQDDANKIHWCLWQPIVDAVDLPVRLTVFNHVDDPWY